MRRDLAIAAFLALSAAALTGTVTWKYFDWQSSGRAMPGATIGGELQPEAVALGDWLEIRRVRLLDREAYFALPDQGGSLPVSFGELGIELDVAATMKAVREHAEGGKPSERLYRALRSRRGEIDLPLVWSLDPERAKMAFSRVAPHVAKEPVDARLDLALHQRIDENAGRELDVDGTLEMLAQGERDDLAVFALATKPIPAKVTSASLANVDVSKVLSAFETNFGGTGQGRAVNIAKAASYLNGFVIAPGQSVSFNQIVGPRTHERGFVMAPVIRDDELEPGLGGGTCQVASTVHAAAVYGALDVQARRSHSRPSGYAPLGLDATVVWGEVDLKFRNPYDTPLIVHAFLPTKTKLRVELLGRDPPGKIEHTYAVVRTHDFYRRVWTKPFVKEGKTIKRQRGIKGYDVVSSVKLTLPGGEVRQLRNYYSEYRPVPEVFWVGPGANLEELPELPEGAKHVEIDGKGKGGEPVSEGPSEGDPTG
ncbi:MAG: VanW family protein [Polyangiaceae bacterium]|nr:VanW family protein [Polyangiaceae bacterium]MCE7890130.1 vancomycin resistance protein [Sorangiineae bacterium PRO1]